MNLSSESISGRSGGALMDGPSVAPALITLTVPAVPEYVGTVRLAVLGIAGRMGFTYDEVEDIRLAVGEACTNAIARIGHNDERSFSITIRAHVEPTTLTVEVEDNIGVLGANGRNADSEASSDLDLLAVRGANGVETSSLIGSDEMMMMEMDGDDTDGQELGALLMEILVDEVVFETTPHGVCVRLLKRVTTRAGNSPTGGDSGGTQTGSGSEL